MVSRITARRKTNRRNAPGTSSVFVYNHPLKRQQIEDRAKEILEATDTRLLAAYFFGSGARGTLSATSDIDIGILLSS